MHNMRLCGIAIDLQATCLSRTAALDDFGLQQTSECVFCVNLEYIEGHSLYEKHSNLEPKRQNGMTDEKMYQKDVKSLLLSCTCSMSWVRVPPEQLFFHFPWKKRRSGLLCCFSLIYIGLTVSMLKDVLH